MEDYHATYEIQRCVDEMKKTEINTHFCTEIQKIALFFGNKFFKLHQISCNCNCHSFCECTAMQYSVVHFNWKIIESIFYLDWAENFVYKNP